MKSIYLLLIVLLCGLNSCKFYYKTADLDTSFKNLIHKYENDTSVHIIKGNSSQILQLLDDNSFDMIYIDADHSYEGSKQDIEIAYAKIKPGGWIMGHDYEMNMNKAKQEYKFGVRQAVDEFCKKYNQTIKAKGFDGCVSFAIKKPNSTLRT